LPKIKPERNFAAAVTVCAFLEKINVSHYLSAAFFAKAEE
jgi:hypothetical protein